MRFPSLPLSSVSATLCLVAATGCGDAGFAPGEPTSELDPSSGEPVAVNYLGAPAGPALKDVYHGDDDCDDAGQDDPADDNDDTGAQDDDSSVVRALSTGYRDVWVGEANDEARVDLPSDYMIVGVGARVGMGSFFATDVTTLVVHARQYEGGELGDIREFRGGREPNHGLEVYCEAPIGHVVTGVGGRVDGHDMTTLHLWTRPFDPATGELGEVEVDPIRCGSKPDAAIEQRLVVWEETPSEEVDRTVWNGISMRAAHGDLTSIRARFRTLE